MSSTNTITQKEFLERLNISLIKYGVTDDIADRVIASLHQLLPAISFKCKQNNLTLNEHTFKNYFDFDVLFNLLDDLTLPYDVRQSLKSYFIDLEDYQELYEEESDVSECHDVLMEALFHSLEKDFDSVSIEL